jgi:hypothetical protein
MNVVHQPIGRYFGWMLIPGNGYIWLYILAYFDFVGDAIPVAVPDNIIAPCIGRV